MCAAAVLATAQDGHTWEVTGGYDFARVGLAGLQAQTNTFAQNNGIPTANTGSYFDSNGFTFGLQENVNNWFSGLFSFYGSYPSSSVNITQQLVSAGFVQSGSSTYTAKGNAQLYTFMFGPQFTLRKSSHVQPFVRVMGGGAYGVTKVNVDQNGAKLTSDLMASDGTFALGGGVGFDIRVTRNVYFRAAGDYIQSSLFNDTQRNLHVSAGITYRFENKEE